MSWFLGDKIKGVWWAGLVVLLMACAGTKPTPTPANSFGQINSLPTFTQTTTVTATNSPTASHTPTPTDAGTPTSGPSPTPSNTPRPSRTPTKTPTASTTPTIEPRSQPEVATFEPFINLSRGPTATPPTAIPTAVPTYEMPAGVTNILLLGEDDDAGGVSRTDTMIVVSINSRDKTASMLSLPRDLYVHVPGWTMGRLNQAQPVGQGRGHPEGGIGALKDTILYNFGIPINYYARVNFDGFVQIVDALGGLEMTINCSLTDWRLISPELDPQDEENWEKFTLDQGVQQMDGDLALWYARSRLSTSDFDRNLRQQQVLRAILNTGVDLGMVTEVPALWGAFQDTVETDMDIGRILQLAAIAPAVRANGIQSLHFVNGDVYPWTIPDTPSTVYLPNWESAQFTVQRLFTPPTLNRGNRVPIFVELFNHTGDDEMALLAAYNLQWYGFIPVIAESDDVVVENSEITYFGENFKGSYNWLLSWVFDMRQSQINLNSEDESEYDYRVVLGEDFNPCRPLRYNPRENLGE